jgi:hypothetical protein
MKQEAFALTRKEIPDVLKGKEIQIHVPENDEDWVKCLENGDLNRRNELARRQYVLDQQREAVAVAIDEEVAKLLATGDVAGALKMAQDAADTYVSSGRKAGDGGTKKRQAALGAKIEAAALDPARAEKIRKFLASLEA